MARQFLSGVGVGLVVMGAFAVGFWPASPAAVETMDNSSARAPHAKPRIQHQPKATQPPATPEAAPSDCEEQTALIDNLEELLVMSGGPDVAGIPMSFPEDLPHQRTPEGFEAAIEEVKRDCKHAIPEGAEIDCSEFPCMVKATVYDQEDGFGFEPCETWDRHFGEGMQNDWRLVKGPMDGELVAINMYPLPREDESTFKSYLEDYELNVAKRNKARSSALFTQMITDAYGPACDASADGEICVRAARHLHGEDAETSDHFYWRACEKDDGISCNTLAWRRCQERGTCDTLSLNAAERAVMLRPTDGQVALDTLAHVLCRRDEVEQANKAFQRSCDAGHTENCSKRC